MGMPFHVLSSDLSVRGWRRDTARHKMVRFVSGADFGQMDQVKMPVAAIDAEAGTTSLQRRIWMMDGVGWANKDLLLTMQKFPTRPRSDSVLPT
jgi:hypothetical protein